MRSPRRGWGQGFWFQAIGCPKLEPAPARVTGLARTTVSGWASHNQKPGGIATTASGFSGANALLLSPHVDQAVLTSTGSASIPGVATAL